MDPSGERTAEAPAALDLQAMTVAGLLSLHAGIVRELRGRGVLRSDNTPTGDLGEYLFSAAFGWTLEGNSSRAFDARDADGMRYQIKARRLQGRKGSRQLSAIRDLEGFDRLAALLIDTDYRVVRAALIPSDLVRAHARFIAHTNSYKFILRDAIWDLSGVIDVTDQLRLAQGQDLSAGL